MTMLQRSDEWFAARAGKVTASRVADLMAKTKSGYSASRQNYMAQLICERLTGKPADSFTSAAMQRGTEKNRKRERFTCWSLEKLSRNADLFCTQTFQTSAHRRMV